MLQKTDIDTELLEQNNPVILASGGSKSVGYKHSEFYRIKLYYLPSDDKFVLSKSSILGVNKFVEPTLNSAIQKYNRLTEDSYTEKRISDEFDVPDYVFDA